ncbi:MAG: class B sortase [Bacilli bacterium]|nr:class B sortase [Bacilli bacterium]
MNTNISFQIIGNVIVISNNPDNISINSLKEIIDSNNINKIKIINYSDNLLEKVLRELIIDNISNIIIEVNEGNNDLKKIEKDIRSLNKNYSKYIKEYKVKIIIHYSNEYKYNNFLKEINFKLLTSIIIFIIVFSSLYIGINYYKQYLDVNKINSTMKNIENIYNKIDNTTSTTTTNQLNVSTSISPIKTTEVLNIPINYLQYNRMFDELTKLNSDTIGWIRINNTKINYPVVQYKDNKYYLNHDFNKDKNKLGWIFMDYRNNPDNLDYNTIIYGHNMRQGLMFGTIKNMFNKSWYTNNDNLTFEFSTDSNYRKWRIFSIYKIDETSNYLKTNFDSKQEYKNFINIITNRSVFDFNYVVEDDDKIITLSTCYGNGVRHVIHAVLIEDLIKK